MQSHDVAATPPPALMHPPVFERIVNSFKDSSALEPGQSSNLLGLVVAKSALWPRLKSKPLLAMRHKTRFVALPGPDLPCAGSTEPSMGMKVTV